LAYFGAYLPKILEQIGLLDPVKRYGRETPEPIYAHTLRLPPVENSLDYPRRKKRKVENPRNFMFIHLLARCDFPNG
jgi:hypothetical protein